MKKFYEDEVYIKMCRGAREIQKNYKIPKKGDFIKTNSGIEIVQDYRYEEEELIVCCDEPFNFDGEFGMGEFVWLPRQDQLQEMINYNFTIQKLDSKIGAYYKVEGIASNDFIEDTIEKGLLQLTMDMNYNKTWNGEDWV